ncbi:MAG: bifunctional riboflavin kinase/FAD synthetase [Candidatus Thiodiazotropha sp. (ex Lucina aurantia)]|uniref:Riboflavin biosynthesis protein n=1 Tax=Candidatus Thiodiazotropha endolucinida TaxID=1655433 RepID=A0A7Z0VKY3_9GAMM|nr:bifunctional riboflavin kinase/FAD synthetase [Candidatus Thiodiazotropha endolucinida]MBT3010505.1 bifunctional riboflavin kinase/FAD synthetase [Candidatus Thiodiazotropha sp. (ex Lucina pensylvanica)]MBT3022185.1 bifunctional riboflavin kinase/FAD synthetase [Candidatus Thiodiazotropha taylori]MBT3040189.1 bifunctional riboflavin kinase/FAD synthetase [Candidatus Thiodiazotropha sp. (ex Codakia orbicularis)]MBV2102218.1 bifunctional riboflavin kinase/FAD synthetase [Candidatus Thiodiazotr
MQIVRGLHNLKPDHHGCVATIGNFDGVHLGHQSVFRHLMEMGTELDLPTTVVTFEPQPREFFQAASAPARLTRMREKLQAIQETGVQRVVVLEFNKRLAGMPAEAFVRELLVEGLGTRFLSVGDDFRFGRGREGDFDLLRNMGKEHGFEVENMNTYKVDADRVSSTRIRELLTLGDLNGAAQCLGRPYRLCGRVAHGNKRGRTIGFPTMNINMHRLVSPLHGVYAVKVEGIGDKDLPGVANIGNRPMVEGDNRYLLEVHLFDFNQDVYGEHVSVEFVQKLRDEQRFESFELLRQQIWRDAERAREILAVADNP